MADLHGSQTRIYLGGVDISTQFRESEAGRKRELVDTTCYGATGDQHSPQPFGLGEMSAEGILEVDATTGVRVIQTAIEAAGDNLSGDDVITFCLKDEAIGDPAFLIVGTVHENAVQSLTKDIAKTKFNARANSSIWGHALHVKAARTAAYTTVGHVSALSAFGGIGALQVFALTGTAPVLAAKLQHSVDTTNGVDGVWVDLGTPFAAINSANVGTIGYADFEAVTGTVNKGVRLVLTVTSGTLTSVTFAAHFGRFTAIQ